MKKLFLLKTQSFTLSETLSTLSNYYLLIALFSFAFFLSCGGDDPPGPEPTPTVTHTINIDGNVEGAIYSAFKNGGELDGDKANTQGDVKLTYLNKDKTIVFDSITGEADGYQRWVVKNQSVGTSKSYKVNL